MTELKPCPFCGGEAILDDHADECMGIYTVFCGECGAMLDFFDTEAEAIEAWNRRVPQTATMKVYDSFGDEVAE